MNQIRQQVRPQKELPPHIAAALGLCLFVLVIFFGAWVTLNNNEQITAHPPCRDATRIRTDITREGSTVLSTNEYEVYGCDDPGRE